MQQDHEQREQKGRAVSDVRRTLILLVVGDYSDRAAQTREDRTIQVRGHSEPGARAVVASSK